MSMENGQIDRNAWQRLMAAAPNPETKWSTFHKATSECAAMVARGAEKQGTVDFLTRMALAHSLDESEVQTLLADAFSREYDVVPDPRPNGRHEPQPQPPDDLPFIDMSAWDDVPVPVQRWAVRDRIPRGQVALFSGQGAAGKSHVQLHLSAAHVLGRDWLGAMPEMGPALFIDAEDDVDVIHRRLAAVVRHYGVRFADLIAGGLHLISLVGRDAVFATANRGGKIQPTPLYHQILQAVGDLKPIMIGIASSANVFAGNEIDRAQVQQFVSLLTQLAIAADGSVVLISHPSLTGISSGSGLSGSTQWHNAVRARFYLKNASGDENDDSDVREIEFQKSNYGPLSEKIPLRYNEGLFLPFAGATSIEKAARESAAESVFLATLGRFVREGRNTSDTSGANYAPALFAKEAEAQAHKLRNQELAAAMRRLFSAQRIHLEDYSRNRQTHSRLALGSKPESA